MINYTILQQGEGKDGLLYAIAVTDENPPQYVLVEIYYSDRGEQYVRVIRSFGTLDSKQSLILLESLDELDLISGGNPSKEQEEKLKQLNFDDLSNAGVGSVVNINSLNILSIVDVGEEYALVEINGRYFIVDYSGAEKIGLIVAEIPPMPLELFPSIGELNPQEYAKFIFDRAVQIVNEKGIGWRDAVGLSYAEFLESTTEEFEAQTKRLEDQLREALEKLKQEDIDDEERDKRLAFLEKEFTRLKEANTELTGQKAQLQRKIDELVIEDNRISESIFPSSFTASTVIGLITVFSLIFLISRRGEKEE